MNQTCRGRGPSRYISGLNYNDQCRQRRHGRRSVGARAAARVQRARPGERVRGGRPSRDVMVYLYSDLYQYSIISGSGLARRGGRRARAPCGSGRLDVSTTLVHIGGQRALAPQLAANGAAAAATSLLAEVGVAHCEGEHGVGALRGAGPWLNDSGIGSEFTHEPHVSHF